MPPREFKVMNSAATGSAGLVCVPSAMPARERVQHFALARELLNKRAAERIHLADGYAFRFSADNFADLVRFIDNERKCCPFMTFVLEMGPQEGPVWLRMTGPEGTREVLKAELSLDGTCECVA